MKDDGTAEFYVDGQLVASGKDPDVIRSGKLALFTQQCSVAFDNFVISSDIIAPIPTHPPLPSSTPTPAPNEYIAITQPQDHQVYQRDIGGTGKAVPFELNIKSSAIAKVQACILNYDTNAEVVPYTDIAINPAIGNATYYLTVPQGGWYKAKIKALNTSGNILAEVETYNKWGVGINILGIGQSNMEGRDINATFILAHDLVGCFYVTYHWDNFWDYQLKGWGPLYDPTVMYGASLVPTMANALAEQYQIPIGYIPAPFGGSPLVDGYNNQRLWSRRNESNREDPYTLYGRALAIAKAAGGVELVVWNQGEDDGGAGVSTDAYKAELNKLITDLRADLNNPNLPFFVCQIGSLVGYGKVSSDPVRYNEGVTAVRAAQAEIDNGKDIFFAAAEVDATLIDAAHLDAKSIYEVGKRVGNAIKYYYGGSTYYRGPEIVGAQFADASRKVIDIKIRHRGGNDIVLPDPTKNITGFSILNNNTSVEIDSAVKLDSNTIRLTLQSAVTGNGTLRYLYGANLLPINTNIVLDNTPLKLPLEATKSDIPIAEGKVIFDLKCYNSAGTEFGSGDAMPCLDNIRIAGCVTKNAQLSSNKLKMAIALYNSNHKLLGCKIAPVDFNAGLQQNIDVGLTTPAATNGCYVKSFMWNSIKQMVPEIPPVYLYK